MWSCGLIIRGRQWKEVVERYSSPFLVAGALNKGTSGYPYLTVRGAKTQRALGAIARVRIHCDFRMLQYFRADSSNWTLCFDINRQITLQPTAMSDDDETSLSGQNHQRCQRRDATGPIRSRSIRPLEGDCTRHVILGDTDRARSSFRCVYTSMVSY